MQGNQAVDFILMRKNPSPQSTYAPCRIVPSRIMPRRILASLASVACLLAAGAIFAASASAQAPALQTTAPTDSSAQPVHRHKRPTPSTPSPSNTVVPISSVVPASIAPPAPPPPNWPAFDKAAEASVVWDSHGLAIDAANSSLQQILKDVSTATGATVDGLSTDQRVFGAFGPGPAREVLSQVLQGSGYNVIMVGDLGQGAPRQILLSIRQAGPAQPTARNNAPGNNNDEDDAAEEPQPPPAPEQIQNRPGFPPGGPPRSPQQIMQEMQLRQQQIQQGQPPQPTQPTQPN